MSRNPKTYVAIVVLSAVVWGSLFLLVEEVSEKEPRIAEIIQSLRHVIILSAKTPKGVTTKRGVPPLERSELDPVPRIPSVVGAAVNVPFAIYYDGIVLAKDPDDVIVKISSSTIQGTSERRCWKVVPRKNDVGRHELQIEVKDWASKKLAENKIIMEVVNPSPPVGKLNVLLVGDSITHQTMYPNLLYNYLSGWTRGNVGFVGTHHPKVDRPEYRMPLPGVSHEGYGGWSWQLFASHHAPGKEEFYKLTKSPFISTVDNKPVLDVRGYLKEQNVEGKLGLVIFQLGLNETFAVDPNNPDALESSINASLQWSDKLISAFREGAPEALIGIVLPAPFTRSAPTFNKAYGKVSPVFADPWRHKRIQHHLLVKMLERYDQVDSRIFLIPVNAAMDVIDGYWISDAGHPNELGARQIAESIYSEILRAIAERTSSSP